ncbi:uncharacterized protein LOC126766803 [Bactrocera neohumeralis]|uniref:uncharacterized protein LOC126766803 n=1 Tax=Bactrocera neohumeralis TaxID=98809 RepID=UPI0021651D12|nr:uncharacterized protein LOC126766803 [Bactrocera neohumeralis]
MASSAVDEDEDGLSDAFTNSHLELIAHIGRVSVCDSCQTLISALQRVTAQASNMAAGSHAVDEVTLTRVNEAVWLVVKVISSLSQTNPTEKRHRSPAASSPTKRPRPRPAVYTAYADALHAFGRCYVEPEDAAAPLFADAFSGGTSFVSFALQFCVAALCELPFEQETMLSVCALLDCMADKSENVRAFLAAQGAFHTVVQLGTDPGHHHFVGHIRGRLLGFAISCSMGASSAEPAAGDRLSPPEAVCKGVLHNLLSVAAQPQGNAVNQLLDCLNTVAGLFESVKRQDVVRAVFAPIMTIAETLLRNSFARFNERELAIEVVQCVHNMFAACVLSLENQFILDLLRLVIMTESSICESLRSTSSWQRSADAESDRVSFLTWSAKLVTTVSLWKRLDCFLADEEVTTLANATVATLATLLNCLDQRVLCFPELEETLFLSLEVCTEAFPELVVLSPAFSNTFFLATFYALTSDRTSTQHAGVAVASHAADCLGNPQNGGGGGGVDELLRVLLRSLVAGKTQQRNITLVAKTILKLSGYVGSPADLQTIVAGVATEVPPPAKQFLEATLFDVTRGVQALSSSSAAQGVSATAVHQITEEFESRLQDHLSLMKGTSLI